MIIAVFTVLVVFMVSVDTASVRKYERPLRETSATYLRLTALRTDEGVWTARFGDYEISVELRHHPKYPNDSEYNDTWTLKVKHSSKRSVLPDENDNEIIGDIVDEPSVQTSEAKETWRDIIDSIDDDDDDVPVFKKVNQPRRTKKAKARRQLPNKSFTTTTENSYLINEDPGKQFIMKELSQGSTRINVVFDAQDNGTEPENLEEMQEINENPWNNIAAVIFDGIPKRFSEALNESILDENKEETYSQLPEKLTDAIALPLQRFTQPGDYDDQQGTFLGKDTSVSANQESFNSPEVVDVDNENEETSTKTSDEKIEEKTENIDNGDSAEGSDYVIEDPRIYDKDVQEDRSESESEVNFSELEVPPEMKRIMEWFPKSRPLAIDNNGYKLFPGVGWFKLVPWAERWSNARKVCETEKARLAVPDSPEKVAVFLDIFKNYPDVLEKSILNNQVFVGIHNVGPPRHFQTVQGDVFRPDFPVWFDGEPDNADPGEDCVTFHAEGKIRDVPCFYNLPFLCEKEPHIT